MAGSVKDLSKYRFEKAIDDINAAESLYNDKFYNVALNRSYYAIFHAIRAVNALDGFDSSKHSGVIAHFNQFHVKTGEFSKQTSKIIRNISDFREQADYEDFYEPTDMEVVDILEKAKILIEEVRVFLTAASVL